MSTGSQQATKATPKHTHNDRRLSECQKQASLTPANLQHRTVTSQTPITCTASPLSKNRIDFYYGAVRHRQV